MIDIRKKVRQVWNQHGGSQHGPHVETMTIPEERFYEFIDAIIRGDAFVPPIMDIQKMSAAEVEHYIHNATAGRTVMAISRPTLSTTGNGASIMAILESVVAGTIMAATKIGGEEIVLDVFIEGVRKRLRELPANSP